MLQVKREQPKSSLPLWVRVLLMLTAPLLAFALFGGATTQAANHTVVMKDSSFQNPQGAPPGTSINIAVGDSVEWVNQDPTSHNVAILDAPRSNVSPESHP